MRSIIGSIINLLGRLISPLAFFITGRKSKELSDVKEENEILRKQRDNDVYNVDDADRVLNEINKDLS